MQEHIAGEWQRYRDHAAVERAEHYARFTIPSLMVDPLESSGSATTVAAVKHDFQSLGSLLVNNLAAKVSLALFPSGMPNFKIEQSEALQELAKREGASESDLKTALATMERNSSRRIFLNGGQHKLVRASKLLITTGDCLIYRDPKAFRFTVWSRQSYAVRRKSSGELRCVILKQRMPFDELDQVHQDKIQQQKGAQYGRKVEIELFTKVDYMRPGVVEVIEESCGVELQRTQYPEHLCPYILPVWSLADGEHYGRGLVEEYAGDFARLSLVTEALGLYELNALELLNIVDESAGGVIDDYQDAEIGDYVPGKVGAITAYERGDYNKIQAINASLAPLTQRLTQAFMYTGMMRDAERVTAEEVRMVAEEAEATLGGVYSLLSESMQVPLAYLTMAEYAASQTNASLLRGIINKDVYPAIITGIPAMTRAAEVTALRLVAADIATILPALVQASNQIDPAKVVEIIANARGVDISSISKSAEVLAQEAQARAAAAATQQMAGAAAAGAAASDLQSNME
jgi:hypothetical protein